MANITEWGWAGERGIKRQPHPNQPALQNSSSYFYEDEFPRNILQIYLKDLCRIISTSLLLLGDQLTTAMMLTPTANAVGRLGKLTVRILSDVVFRAETDHNKPKLYSNFISR